MDILKAVQKINSFARDADRVSLAQNQQKQSAILYQLIVIGEAVKRLSTEFRSQHPDIPWREMTGMRDIIPYQYDKVNLDILWEVIEQDIPRLYSLLKPLLSEDLLN